MRKLLTLILFSVIFLVQCGGADGPTTEPVSSDGTEGTTFSATPAVGSKRLTSTAGGLVSVEAGYAGNGTTISIPTGFTIDQCVFTAAPATIDGSALSVSASVNTTTGEVVCEKVVQEREEVPAETRDCVASFTMMCVQ